MPDFKSDSGPPTDTSKSAGTLIAETALMEAPSRERLAQLANGDPYVALRGLRVGYSNMEVVHGIDLMVGKGQSLCIVGPNGAGKSTVLHGVFGLADIFGGSIEIAGQDVTGASVSTMLMQSKAVYVLQSSSIFPDMTVEENLFMGGFLLDSRRLVQEAAESIFDAYPKLAQHRNDPAGVLSGGERRLLELTRALITEPEIIVIDEPSIGLEPRAVETVFEMLERLQRREGKTIIVVEQNAKKGLQFADIGYVIVSGRLALADQAADLLKNPRVSRLFLGG